MSKSLKTSKGYTLAELAAITGSKLEGDPSLLITDVADLETATSKDASFLANARYERTMGESQAGVIFIHPQVKRIPGKNFLVNDDPSRAFQKIVDELVGKHYPKTGFSGIHPSAVVHHSVKLGKDVNLGPHVVIDQGVEIGEGTTIGAGTYVGAGTKIGKNCFFYPNVTIREGAVIGNNVVLQPGCVIGSCGFGYTTNKEGKHIKLNQVGNVVLEDDVEIGANTTIDRSRFKSTIIRRGSKIDNLVQIGHGVVVGEDNIIVSQTGIAGSTKTGRHVILAGQVAVAGHIEIADGVVVSACSGVSKSMTKAGKYGGVPVMPLDEYNRKTVYLRNIDKYVDQIKALEERLAALEDKDEKDSQAD